MNLCTGYEWSTHQPLIRAVLESYKPKFILELGAGEFSTPIFIDEGINFLSVENNKEWIEKLQEEYKIKVLFHDLGIEENIHYNRLTAFQKAEIERFYKSICIPPWRPNLLFVDQYMSCRAISINTLRDKFDLIIYHDSEEVEVNRYDLIDKRGFEFNTLKTPKTSTTLMSRIDQKLNIDPFIDLYLKEHPDCEFMIYE